MNWRKIVAISAVAGMLAVTGCSSNVPERNQGNRNGQRVVDAVNGRADSYSGERTTRGIFGRTTRGVNRAANRGLNRATNNYAANRATGNLGRPQNRIGNDFRHGMTHTNRGISGNHTYRANRVSQRNLIAEQTVPVFFNKNKEAAPAPTTTPAPTTAPTPQAQ
jgi:outer membrane protein assembly factor BamE (lipoprotein component of BamABCDE complex)